MVNTPLLDVIKQVLKTAKFLKNLCTYKERLKGNDRVILDSKACPLNKQRISK